MFGYKQFIRYFFYVFAIFYSLHIPIAATETADIPSLYTDTLRAKLERNSDDRSDESFKLNSSPSSPTTNEFNADLLETAFSQTSRISLPPPIRRVVAALAAAFASVLCFQTLVPMGMIGLGELGLTAEILPPDTAGANAVVAAMALTPLIMGTEATYHGVIRKLKSLAPEVLDALKIVNQRHLSKFESWTYSYPTQAVQMMFWSGLFIALVMNIESRVEGWGNPVAWGAVLGTLLLPAIWGIFVNATNNPNQGIMHFLWNKANRNTREDCLQKLNKVGDIIKERGLTPNVKALGENFGILSAENDENNNNNDNDDNEARVGGGAQSDWRAIADPQEAKKRYEVILGTMQKIISEDGIPYLETWNRFNLTIANTLSPILQAAALPGRLILTYGLMHKFAGVCGADDKVSLGLGAATAVLTGVFHVLAAAKESSNSKREIYDTLHLWKPQRTWGPKSIPGKVLSRVPPLLARGAVFVYFIVPFKNYLEKGILDAEVGITDPVTQGGLIYPFLIASLYPPVAQFISDEYEHVTNWFASGGPAGKRKIFFFLDSQEVRAKTLAILDRTEDFRKIVEGLNFAYTSHVNAELGDTVRTSLLKS